MQTTFDGKAVPQVWFKRADVFCIVDKALKAASNAAEPLSVEAKTWAAYIAGMIETYLNFDHPKDGREAAIAGIIERRMCFGPFVAAEAVPPASSFRDQLDEWERSGELKSRAWGALRDQEQEIDRLRAVIAAVPPASSADTWGDTIKHLVGLNHDDFLSEAKRILDAHGRASDAAEPAGGKDDGYDPEGVHVGRCLAARQAYGGKPGEFTSDEERKWSAVVKAVDDSKPEGRPWNVLAAYRVLPKSVT